MGVLRTARWINRSSVEEEAKGPHYEASMRALLGLCAHKRCYTSARWGGFTGVVARFRLHAPEARRCALRKQVESSFSFPSFTEQATITRRGQRKWVRFYSSNGVWLLAGLGERYTFRSCFFQLYVFFSEAEGKKVSLRIFFWRAWPSLRP